MVTLLDGPMGTALAAQGLRLPAPLWSAQALIDAPDHVAALHRAYREAGAAVLTANTFRTQPVAAGAAWIQLTHKAVRLARAAAGGADVRVAGSMAPIADCYRPDLSPARPGRLHQPMAQALADAGCDLLLVETFPHTGEAAAAVEAGVATGLPVWVALTAGPDAALLTPAALAQGARDAVARGASAALVNCVPARHTLDYLRPLADLGVPFGAYANAGVPTAGLGWDPSLDPRIAGERYADIAEAWVALGATLVGSCCGTGPDTIAALHRRFVAP